MTRYLSGLCVAGLGLCGGGWLVVAAVAFGGESAGLAGRVNLLTGAGLIAVCCLSLVCWSFAWRQRMCVDGVLAEGSLLVSKRQARRNRRALSRDVRRAGKLAERSARGARRAARRSARAGSGSGGGGGGGGVLSDALSDGGVRRAGVGLAGASPADEPRNVAVSYGTNANSVNGTSIKGLGANRSGGTGANGDGANGSARTGVNGSAEDGAAELISQLREMLVPLLATTGSQPTLGGQAATGSQPTLGEQAGAGSQPNVGEQAGAAGLPRRTPSASAFRPRVAPVPAQVPRAWVPQRPAPQAPVLQRPVLQRPAPQVAVPAMDDDGLGGPVDSEEAWW